MYEGFGALFLCVFLGI